MLKVKKYISNCKTLINYTGKSRFPDLTRVGCDDLLLREASASALDEGQPAALCLVGAVDGHGGAVGRRLQVQLRQGQAVGQDQVAGLQRGGKLLLIFWGKVLRFE